MNFPAPLSQTIVARDESIDSKQGSRLCEPTATMASRANRENPVSIRGLDDG
jgi:hypothetical protein